MPFYKRITMKSLKKKVLKIIEMSEEDYFKQLNSDKKFIIEDSHQTSNMMRKKYQIIYLKYEKRYTYWWSWICWNSYC